MINYLLGFRQEKIIEWGLDAKDIWILKYLKDLIETGKMSRVVYENKIFYWINYAGIKEYLPFLGINDNNALRRRFVKYEKLKIVEHFHRTNESGSYSYYRFGEGFFELIKNMTECAPAHCNMQQNNSLNKNNKKNNKKIYDKKDYEEIWSLYPLKRGKARAMKSIPKILKDIDKDELMRAILRYKEEKINEGNNNKYMLNGSTFFNGRYLDYIDKNFLEEEENDNASDYDVIF